MILRYTLPPNAPKKFESESDSVILGRRPKPGQHIDLDLTPDSYVSKRHAHITFENGEYWIKDLGSGNGTWVDGQKITIKTQLTPESKVRVGWTNIEIEMETTTSVPGPGAEQEPEDVIVAEPEQEQEPEDVIVAEPEQEQAPEGTIVTEQDQPTESEGEKDTMPTQGWRQLKALNDFSKELETGTGAVLLPDEQGELLLKAHWPQGDHSVSMTWVKRAFTKREAFIWTAAAPADTSGDDTPHSAIYYDVQSAIYVPLLLGGDVFGVMYVDNYYARDAFAPVDLEMLKAIANQVAMFIRDNVLRKDLKREEVLRSNLLRQFSPKVAEQMVEKAARLQRGGERSEPVTILISDVRHFTALSSKMEPDDVVRMLNEMFDAFVPIISEYDGVVDKFVGDSVLAVFGSPQSDPQQWEKAAQAAIEMQHAMHMLGEGRKVRRLPAYQVGIGIHTGGVIHGFIGSAERIEFTVIGDTVNRAARYCDGADPGEILISKAVYEHVYGLVEVEPKTVKTKHPKTEKDLDGYLVKGLKKDGKQSKQ
ncbi:MAG: FHA domain-containing protein [Deltaproteobacteria bacterium]|nr:FHA domain-containing protein [Deltaproteobacteria bacterium]